MKHLILMIFLSVNTASCSPNDTIPNQQNSITMDNKLKITIGKSSFNVTLYDNAAVTAFKAMLPMTISMSEMNGNEKLHYLPNRLPTSTSASGKIYSGDLMLWGSDCLVLFYKNFSSSYSYTKLGYTDDASGLETALGKGNATITFELSNV